jgi:AraC family transcriptional regulator, transcriptional activator of pobA
MKAIVLNEAGGADKLMYQDIEKPVNTQQNIHLKLIDKAKELLSTTSLTVSEIAYALGFEQIQSFSKLFKTKTNVSPLEFRQSFN